MAVPTIAGSEVDAWAEVAAASVREGAAVDVSDSFAATLHIDAALSSTNAMGTVPEIIIEISSAASGDSYWHKLTSVAGPSGTASKADFAATEAAGQTELSITNPATANLDHNGKYVFIKDATVANSEIAFQTANTADAGDTVTVLDGITSQHLDTADMFTLDGAAPTSAVSSYNVTLPFPCCRARVLVNNQDADATLHTRTRITKCTAVS